jgi:hypothetical protein
MHRRTLVILFVGIGVLCLFLVTSCPHKQPVANSMSDSTYTMPPPAKYTVDSTSTQTTPVRSAVNPNRRPAATQLEETVDLEHKYWIDTVKNLRHNASCRYYGKTKKGYYTGEPDAHPCRICGG